MHAVFPCVRRMAIQPQYSKVFPLGKWNHALTRLSLVRGGSNEGRGHATDASRHALRQRGASDAHAVVMGPP